MVVKQKLLYDLEFEICVSICSVSFLMNFPKGMQIYIVKILKIDIAKFFFKSQTLTRLV